MQVKRHLGFSKNLKQLACLHSGDKGSEPETCLMKCLPVVQIEVLGDLGDSAQRYRILMVVAALQKPLFPIIFEFSSSAHGNRSLEQGDRLWPTNLQSSLGFDGPNCLATSLVDSGAESCGMSLVTYNFLQLTLLEDDDLRCLPNSANPQSRDITLRFVQEWDHAE